MNSTDVDASGHIISPFYGYLPTRSTCYIFVILFGIVTVAHFAQAIRYRAWWLIPTAVLAGGGEVAGWYGRLWSSYSPLNQTPYTIQIICTIIAPTPLVGAVFISFGRLSLRLGQQYSRLSARLYSRLFLTCDILALFAQSVGGAMASSPDADVSAQDGANIMLGGIIFQLAALSVFALLMAEYIYRYTKDAPVREQKIPLHSNEALAAVSVPVGRGAMTKEMKLFIVGMCIETFLLFIRAIYRTIELADGINGRIIRTEVYFNVLDATMVVLAMYTMAYLHPARLLRAHPGDSQQDTYPMISKESKFAQL